MGACSILEVIARSQHVYSLYINYAAQQTDPVERFKMVLLTIPCNPFAIKVFDKPLNPILGETYEAWGQDGAKIYMEQTSHHPPISHTIIDGPDGLY